MRLMISKSKNAKFLYAIKSVYENGKRSTKIVKKLGTLSELEKIHEDPILWAKLNSADSIKGSGTNSGILRESSSGEAYFSWI